MAALKLLEREVALQEVALQDDSLGVDRTHVPPRAAGSGQGRAYGIFSLVVAVTLSAGIAAGLTALSARWDEVPETPSSTISLGQRDLNAEIVQLREALDNAEAKQKRLQESLDETLSEVRTMRQANTPPPWFADTNLLMYRDPWAR